VEQKYLNTGRTILLKLDTDLKIILLDYQNNYVKRMSDDNAAKSFNILVTSLSILYNYFDDPNRFIFRAVSSHQS